MVAYHKEEYARAAELYEECLTLHRAVDDHWGIALTLSNLGESARAQGDFDARWRCWRRAWRGTLPSTIRMKWPSRSAIWVTPREIRVIWRARLQLYARSIATAHEAGSISAAADGLEGAAEVAYTQEQAAQATRLFALATALREKHQVRRLPSDQARRTSQIAKLRAALGDEAFTVEWAEGRVMSLEECARADGLCCGASRHHFFDWRMRL